MTLVAFLNPKEGFYMFGDALVTTNVDSDLDAIDVPTLGDTTEYLGLENARKPTSLVEKVCIVNNQLCFGWSGNRIAATSFYRFLKEELGDQEIDENLYLELYEANKGDFLGLDVIVHGVRPVGERPWSWVHCPVGKGIETKEFGGTIAIGSGAGDFLDFVARTKENNFKKELHPPSEDPQFEPEVLAANTKIQHLISYFYCMDSSANNTVIRGYGGYYEVIGTAVGCKLVKLNNNNIVYRRLFIQDNQVHQISPAILYMPCQEDGVTFLKRIVFSKEIGSTNFVIRPIYDTHSEFEFPEELFWQELESVNYVFSVSSNRHRSFNFNWPSHKSFEATHPTIRVSEKGFYAEEKDYLMGPVMSYLQEILPSYQIF
jgi:hypothetical protein